MKKTQTLFTLAITAIAGATLTGSTMLQNNDPKIITSAPEKTCSNAKIVTPTSTKTTPEEMGLPNSKETRSLLKNRNIEWLKEAKCVSQERKTQAANYNTTNWSGYVATNPKINTANYAATTYTHPKMSTLKNEAEVAIWTGIGGFKSPGKTLIQNGTYENINKITKKQQRFFWFEVVPKETMQMIVPSYLPLRPNDNVTVISSWKNNKATFAFCNNTLKKCATFQESNIAAPGNSAEWIVEKPVYANGAMKPLANYGKITFTNNKWQMNSSGQPIHGINGWSKSINLVSKNNFALNATQGNIVNQSFTSYWKAAN